MEIVDEVLMEIEGMRRKLHDLIAEDDGLKSPQILWMSQKIDVLLLKYYGLNT